jgi:hypothetical protein
MQHQHTNPFSRPADIKTREVRIDFSFKREVFFIIAGALVGRLAIMIPLTFFNSLGITGTYFLYQSNYIRRDSLEPVNSHLS